MKKTCFFFGAGAEGCYDLPLGSRYTFETMCQKDTKMMDALEIFYSSTKEILKYEKQFIFAVNSYGLKKILYLTGLKCRNIGSAYDEKTMEIINNIQNGDTEESFDATVVSNDISSDFYNNVIIKAYNYNDDNTDYKGIINNLIYYGTIEKDFSTITNPEEAGKRRFWRLINYFWKAYFTILIPILDNTKDYSGLKEYNDNKYKYILEHLFEISSYITDSDCLNDYKYTDNKTNYYKEIKSIFSNHEYKIITSNYTDFSRLELGVDENNIAYLAGKLNWFETQGRFGIYDFSKNDNRPFDNDIIFPFLMTQAPIKPIIEPKQLREYYKADIFLNESDVLVVLGYNINPNDDHINAILNDYLSDSNKRMIYCKYVKNEKEYERNTVISNLELRLKLQHTGQIDVLPIYGKDMQFADKLNKIIYD